jgi:hypothetical protein
MSQTIFPATQTHLFRCHNYQSVETLQFVPTCRDATSLQHQNNTMPFLGSQACPPVLRRACPPFLYPPCCLARFTRPVVWRGLPALLFGGCGGNHFLTESSLDQLANGLEMTINYSPEIQRRIQNLIPYFSLLTSCF